jgi:hypothetical protein
MIDVKDRVPTYPGRIKLTKPDGTSEYYTLERADAPTQEGTPINKALFDSIKADFDTKAPKLNPTFNGKALIQGDAPEIELWDPVSDSRARIYKDANANADYGTIIADIDVNGDRDLLRLRRAATLADKLALLVEQPNNTHTTYQVYGAHNKPWGSYTGNGVTSVRQVATGGNGFACIVRSSSGTCIVMGSGVMRAAGGTFTWLPSGQSYFKNGILYIASTDAALNASGTTYTYEVL